MDKDETGPRTYARTSTIMEIEYSWMRSMRSWYRGPVSSLLTNKIVDKDTLHLKWNGELDNLYIVRSEILI